MVGQFRQNVVMQTIALDLNHHADRPCDQRELDIGRPAVERQIGNTGRLLALEAAHAFAEVFVQIAGGDRDKFQALQQWCARVNCLVQHAPVEVQPAQFAIVDLFGRTQLVERERREVAVGFQDGLAR